MTAIRVEMMKSAASAKTSMRVPQTLKFAFACFFGFASETEGVGRREAELSSNKTVSSEDSVLYVCGVAVSKRTVSSAASFAFAVRFGSVRTSATFTFAVLFSCGSICERTMSSSASRICEAGFNGMAPVKRRNTNSTG